MTIDTLIRQDHTVLLKQAKAMSTTDKPVQARAHYKALQALLEAHSRAEEAVVYRALDRLGMATVREATQEGEVEHSLCDHLMAQLAKGKADSALWKARAKVVYELLVHHIEEEHQEMLPLLEKHFNVAQREALAKRFEQRKGALMGE
jgi:hemerythrin-like domain-containing protein